MVVAGTPAETGALPERWPACGRDHARHRADRPSARRVGRGRSTDPAEQWQRDADTRPRPALRVMAGTGRLLLSIRHGGRSRPGRGRAARRDRAGPGRPIRLGLTRRSKERAWTRGSSTDIDASRRAAAGALPRVPPRAGPVGRDLHPRCRLDRRAVAAHRGRAVLRRVRPRRDHGRGRGRGRSWPARSCSWPRPSRIDSTTSRSG